MYISGPFTPSIFPIPLRMAHSKHPLPTPTWLKIGALAGAVLLLLGGARRAAAQTPPQTPAPRPPQLGRAPLPAVVAALTPDEKL